MLLVVAALAVPVVQAANRLRVTIDGEIRSVLSFEDTVGELLASEGVVVAAGDEILPAPDTPLEQVAAAAAGAARARARIFCGAGNSSFSAVASFVAASSERPAMITLAPPLIPSSVRARVLPTVP